MTQHSSMFQTLRGFLLFSFAALVLPGQSTTYRPGVTDPAGNPRNFTLFRDEQVYSIGVPSAAGSPWRTATMGFDGNLNPSATVASLPWSSDVPVQQINAQAVAGRILHPDKDDIVVVQRSGTDSSKLAVRFSDGSGTTLVGNMQGRSSGYADFFATSAGDLDKLYDSTGNYHDEVVVAWMEPNTTYNAPHCLSAGAVPHIAVLNYNSGTSPSIVTQTVNRSDSQYLAYCILDIYNQQINLGRPTVPAWAPMPGDNIMATAIGDFDGDGQNEIAVAYMRGTAGLVISVVIFRYQNDGTTASLTPVSTFETSVPNKSLVATLSLAAGNFDGSGIDQLVVGTATWWGTPLSGEYQSGTFISQPVAFLLSGGQTTGSITAAKGSGTNNANTDFTVNLGSGVYVPQTVTIAGATGTWAPINGTWAVAPTSTGFTLGIDSSTFGSFTGQRISVTTAAPLQQADFISLEPIPGTTSGGIEVDNRDVDAYIRVQVIPGLFHYDPSSGFDYRRRQIAMVWNSRAAVRYTTLTQNGDPHLALLQITAQDKIQVASTTNFLIGNWQLFQTLSVAAGAFVGNSDTNDPTWSLYFAGVGSEFDLNQSFGSRNVYQGMVNAIWKVSRVDGDATKLNPQFVCSDKATADTYQPPSAGTPLPRCPTWGDPGAAYKLGATDNLNALRLPTVAADLAGNSLRLGAPVHLEITNPGKAHFILEQPPQHAAWLDQGNGPTVVTVNRYPSFNTSLAVSDTQSFASKDQDHTDWTAGVSEKLTAQATWGFGADAGPLADWSEQNTAKLSARVSYDYDHVHSNYTSGYDSITTGQAAATGEDDSLIVEQQILDLWRYRIYGPDTATGDPNNPYAFYDMVIPGPSLVSSPGGRDVDWYQPQHEVGNILSYPSRTDVCSPSDIGAITIPNLNISNQVIPLIGCQQVFYNGNSKNLSLQLDHQTGSGDSTDYTNKVSTGLDFKYTYRVDFELFGNGGQFKASTDTDVHGGQNWGHLSTSDSSTTGATSIMLNSPQGDSPHAYPYYPIFYNTDAGGLRVAYGVGDLSGSSSAGGPFWTNNYATAPDPALNLPNRFDATYSPEGAVTGWAPHTTIVRKRMKGFVIRRAEVDSITGTYPLLGSNPQDGDKVLLEARVYNYSLSATAANFTVQFSVIPYDSSVNNEICPNIPTTGKGGRVCPASVRQVIGIGTTQPTGGTSNFSLSSRGNTYAYLVWDTKTFGPATAGFKEYRVYVNLIASGSELYPPEKPCTALPCDDDFSNQLIVDPGQNNEGWGLISIANRAEPQPLAGTKSITATHGSLGTEAMTGRVSRATGSPDTLARKKTKREVAYLFQPVLLRITAFSGAQSHIHGHVTILDGKPGRKKTKTVAIKTVHGVSPDGKSSWFSWMPKTKGRHHLYAVLHTTSGTTVLGDLVIRVRRAPGDLNEDGRVDTHDLNMLSLDLGKSTLESACGAECDLDGDGKVTKQDFKRMSRLCDSQSCAFSTIEYTGHERSPNEPDMRVIRQADAAIEAEYLAEHGEDQETPGIEDSVDVPLSYQAELKRKQARRSVQYWYKGQPVTSGRFAQ